MRLFPSRDQWRKWSLPSKLTAVGAYAGIISIPLALALFAFSLHLQPTENSSTSSQPLQASASPERSQTSTNGRMQSAPLPMADKFHRQVPTQLVASEELLEGWLGERHHPRADGDLIALVLNNEGATVKLLLHLGPDITTEFTKMEPKGARTYSFALADPEDPLLMDLHLLVDDSSEFYFGVESPGTGILRGTFHIRGCAQTGSGWFSCKLRAVPIGRK